MASIRAFCRFFARPPLLALFLALGGVAGLAPWSEQTAAKSALVVDRSASCEAPRMDDKTVFFFDAGNGSAALARAAAPAAVGRVRLYTDAVFRAMPALPGKPVDVVLCPRRDDAGILDLRVPARIAPGEDFRVEVLVGRTVGEGAPIEVNVSLHRDGERIGAARRVRLRRGAQALVAFRDRVSKQGIFFYRAEIAGAPGDPGNDRRDAILRAGERPVVLVVGTTVLDQRFHVIRKSPAQVAGFLGDPAIAARIDAILLGEPLGSLRAQHAVAEAVRGGAGLVLPGGGGYAGRPLERVLPLTDRPPGGRATVLLLDFSGSMAPLLAELETGVRRLLAAFAPQDRVALISYRAAVVGEQPFQAAATARWERRGGERPQGNTDLAPALRRARELLASTKAMERRIFVVSDGEWKDTAEAAALLGNLGDIKTAILYVGAEQPHAHLFDTHFTAGADLAAALESMERLAPDRLIPGGPITPVHHDVADWLRGALPRPRGYPGAVRLFPRTRGERLALLDREKRPLLATFQPGGRVVVVALEDFPIQGLVAACARSGGNARLEVRHDGGELVLRARGTKQLPFVVGRTPVASRPIGPDRWGARVPAPTGAVQVRFGSAIALAPPAAREEHDGLANRPQMAARIAQLSGGRFYRTEPHDEPASKERPAAYVLLLLAAACVVWSAVVRRAS